MTKKIILCLIVFQIFLAFLQLGLTFGRATDGDVIVRAEAEVLGITSGNEALKTQIEQASTISSVYHFAQTSGMVPAVLTKLSPASVAIRPEMP